MTRRGRSAQSKAWAPTGTPVAVVGIGCRFPGANGLAQFWQLLSGGRDAISEVPASRYDIDAYHDPRPGTPNRIVSRGGGFLDQIDEFDAGFFGVAPREAERMDPQQRLLLETAAEAMADAGLTRDRLSTVRAGVYIGGMSSAYGEMLGGAGVLDLHAATGGARSFLSGRVSFAFDLRGPSVTVDCACSSSLAALHMAYQSVRNGETQLALAGGVNLVISPAETIPFSAARMLAPDGRCKFGSAHGDGFVRSEGVAVLVLKALERAEADGDAIHAVIYGSAVGNDGQSGGYLLTPSQAGQEETLRAAYADAGVPAGQVDYVEAHGTGTAAGDPVELGALGAVLGEGRAEESVCLVGSVKTNIGHTEATAGLAGVIKAVLALKHREIPPSLHAEDLTGAVDWDGLRLRLVRESTPWPRTGRPGLAGVSSFGISGTNAHVVLGEYQPAAVTASDADGAGGAQVLAISAQTEQALTALAVRYAEFLEPGGAGRELPPRDVCFSAATRREHHESRLTAVGASADELAERLRAYAAGESRPRLGVTAAAPVEGGRPQVVFVFPGQGSQWDGMGRELLAGSPVFRDTLTRCDEVIRSEVGWSLLDRLTGAAEAPATIDTIQPTLWAMQTALCAVLRDWGIEPDHVVGHSMGEVAAACAAGALSLADAGAVICRRSKLLRGVAGRGAMYSVELSVADAQAALAGHEHLVSVAVSNSPTSTVISGDPEALAAIVKGLDERGVFCRQVKVDVASHSPQMDQLREELLASLGELAPRAGRVPLYSTVDDASCDGSGLDAAYWVRNLREPVRFGAAVAHLAGRGDTVFVEVSPHPILLPAIREGLALAGTESTATGCLRRDEPERASMLDTVGALHRAGYPVDWPRVFGEPSPRYVRLPSYPWQRQRYWLAPPPAAPGASDRPARHRVERLVDASREPYLLDHQVQGTVVLPGTAYVEMVHGAATGVCGGQVPLLRDIRYLDALFLRPDAPAPALSIVLTSSGADTWDFEVTSDEAVHVTGAVTRTPPPEERRLALDPLRAACPDHRTGADFYRRFAARGNEWRGTFQGIAELWVGDGQALGRIQVPGGVDPAGYTCHPALLDACGQVLAALIPEGDRSSAFVLGSIDEVTIHPSPGTPAWAHAAHVTAWRSDSFCGDVTISDVDGRVIVEIRGLRLQYLQPPDSVRDPEGWFHELRWQPLPALPAVVGPGGRRLVFADRSGVGDALPAEIRVYPGAGYRRLGPGWYEIDPSAPAEYRRLLADVRAEFDGLAPTEVVHLWTLDAEPPDPPAPAQRQAEAAERLGCASVLRLLRALAGAALPEPPRLALVTRGAYRVLDTDRTVSMWQGALWGLGRVLAHEHRELRCALVDLDPAGAPADLAAALARELDSAGPEDQLALRDGHRYAARLLRTAGAGQPDGAEVTHEVRATIPGMLDGMRLEPVPRRAPGPGQVEVRADYLALNYRDVLVAMDMYPTLPGRPGMIVGECAGTVTRVGPGVAGLRPGDEVVAIALETPAATYMCVNAHLVRRRPARLTAAEAASVPIALVTAYHSLVHLARLRPGERVLIHHATGGVGMAAVQLARWRGAEVYATAGSPEKRAMLRMMGVAHACDSRGGEFADEIREATRGEGVDVVLNTLAGEGLLKSVELLADRGRYVELSRRDLVEGTQLDMRLLARGASFFVVDVVDLGLSDPRRLGAIMEETLALVQAGVFEPLPHRVFPAADIVGAYRHMAQARHIGKVLVSTVELTTPAPEVAPAPHRPVRIDPSAGYLVTGGLGDLGRIVTDWLVREGARHIVLTGRTPLDRSASAGWLEELRRHGVHVAYEAVDVADEEAMRAVVRHHERDGATIRGVVHAAGVIEYSALSDLDAQALAAVLRPKVTGAAVLHRLFAERQLDFFVLFSSGSAVLSSPMLGAYAAANAALDALADQRRLAGLTALSVNWGFWSVGMPARAGQEQGRAINPAGMDTFSPREGIEALRLLLARGATHGVVLPADWQTWAVAHPDAATSPLLRELVAGPAAAPVGGAAGTSASHWATAAGFAPSAAPVSPGMPAGYGLPVPGGVRASGGIGALSGMPGPVGVPAARGLPASLGMPAADGVPAAAGGFTPAAVPASAGSSAAGVPASAGSSAAGAPAAGGSPAFPGVAASASSSASAGFPASAGTTASFVPASPSLAGPAPAGVVDPARAGVAGPASAGVAGSLPPGVAGSAPGGVMGSVPPGVAGSASAGVMGSVPARVAGSASTGVGGPAVAGVAAHGPAGVAGHGPAGVAGHGNGGGGAAAAGNGVAATLTDRAAVERYLAQVLADVLGMPSGQVNLRRPLKRQGLDSLMAVEVRTRVQRDLGMLLPIAKMLGGHSVADLAGEVLTHLTTPAPH